MELGNKGWGRWDACLWRAGWFDLRHRKGDPWFCTFLSNCFIPIIISLFVGRCKEPSFKNSMWDFCGRQLWFSARPPPSPLSPSSYCCSPWLLGQGLGKMARRYGRGSCQSPKDKPRGSKWGVLSVWVRKRIKSPPCYLLGSEALVERSLPNGVIDLFP